MAPGRKRKNPEPEVQAEHVKQETHSEVDTSGKDGVHVHPDRIRELRGGEVKPGPVIYWSVRCCKPQPPS